MLETQDRTIDGVTFRYQPMMAKPARELFDKLLQAYGPALAAAVEALEKAEDLDLESDVAEMLGAVIGSVGGSIREITFATSPVFHREIAEALHKQSMIKNDDGNFVPLAGSTAEMLFGTKLLTEAKFIGYCLEVQFSDFFELFKTGAMRALAMKAAANQSRFGSPKISTGTSPE